LASIIGTSAWLLGLTGKIWPAHPMWAVLFVTLGATVLLLNVLLQPEKQ
jgi:hypothetical protein